MVWYVRARVVDQPVPMRAVLGIHHVTLELRDGCTVTLLISLRRGT